MGQTSSIDIAGGLRFTNNANTNTNNTTSNYINMSQFGEWSIYNTTPSTNSSTGACMSYAGVTIFSTSNSTNYSIGNALTIAGGTAIGQNIYSGGKMNIGYTIGNNFSPLTISTYPYLVNNNLTIANHIVGTWVGSGGTLRSFSFNTNNYGLGGGVTNNFNSNNAIDFRTNNISRLFIDGSYGNVNIGTTTNIASPTVPLYISGSTSSVELCIQNTTIGYLRLGVSNTGGPFVTGASFLASHNSGSIQIGVSTTGNLRSRGIFIYTSVGNVGIGNTAPAFTLDVTGNANFNTGVTTAELYATNLTSQNSVLTHTSFPNAIHTNATMTNLISTTINTSSTNLSITGITTNNLNFTGNLFQNGILFSGSNLWGYGTGGNLFYTSGNVGIGPSVPEFALDVGSTVGTRIQTGITSTSITISTLGNILNTNTINTFGNMIFNTAGTTVFSNFKYMNNKLRTSRYNALNCVTNWYTRTAPVDNYTSICWSSDLSLFAACAYNTNGICTSPDGITWTARAPSLTGNFQTICWSSELQLFVAAGTLVATSPNGTTWTTRVFTPLFTLGICWSPELLIFTIVGSTGFTGYSSNGTTWTTAINYASAYWLGVCWSPELSLFVAVGNSVSSGAGLGLVMSSPDGINWTSRIGISNDMTSVCWSGELGLFVAVSYNYATSMTSTDGITWTPRALLNSANNQIVWSPELSIFFVIGPNYSGYSVDGVNWSTAAIPFLSPYPSLCWSPELSIFVIGQDALPSIYTSAIALPNSNNSALVASPAHITYNTSNGNISITGALSKGSGSFDIPHPLVKDTRLVHSFIEGPRCDLIYRGSIQLVNGTAIVNIDNDCVAENMCTMTQGTFEALTSNHTFTLENATSFDKLRGEIHGNMFTILCENESSSDTVYWCVIAERKDPTVQSWERTNKHGYLITEYTK